MRYDLELIVQSPAERVFNLVRNWHTVEELRHRSHTRDFHSYEGSRGHDYFRQTVKELPLKKTYCYGKRLFRPPVTMITMFVYRFFKSPELNSPERIENAIARRWDDFFYETVRLTPQANGNTSLRYLDSTGLGSEAKRDHYLAYFETLKELSETQIVATGVDVIAEPVDEEFPDDDLGGDTGDPETQETITYDIYDDYDPYRILGISRKATMNEVKQAYRNKAKAYHPDVQGAAQADYGHGEFVEITAAYHAILRERE